LSAAAGVCCAASSKHVGPGLTLVLTENFASGATALPCLTPSRPIRLPVSGRRHREGEVSGSLRLSFVGLTGMRLTCAGPCRREGPQKAGVRLNRWLGREPWGHPESYLSFFGLWSVPTLATGTAGGSGGLGLVGGLFRPPLRIQPSPKGRRSLPVCSLAGFCGFSVTAFILLRVGERFHLDCQ